MITQCCNCAHCYDTKDSITRFYVSMCDVKGRNVLLIDNGICPHYKKLKGERTYKENDEVDFSYIEKLCQ